MQSEAFGDMGEKEFSYPGCIDGFGTWNDNYPLHKAVVDHNQNGVHPVHLGEICDKVNQELFEGKGGHESNGV